MASLLLDSIEDASLVISQLPQPDVLTLAESVILVCRIPKRADVANSGKLPGVEALRRNGITFQSAFPRPRPLPISHSTVMTGLQPCHHGVRHLIKEMLDRSCETLATFPGERGMTPAASRPAWV